MQTRQIENSFFTWDNFVEGLEKEIGFAEDTYSNMIQGELTGNCLIKMDFTFVSDKKDNLIRLGEFIKIHYPYIVYDVKKYENLWEINGETNEIPITEDNLLYWVLDMYKRGYEFDAKLDAYGGLFDPQSQKFPDLEKSKEDFYFNKGMKCYENGDLSGALINWTLTININPEEPNSYYSRAIVKNELYTWKSALKDYDKAISIAPDFISALINRGSLKDENGDYKGAIEDYNKVLSMESIDKENKPLVYFNRGNTKFNLNDKKGACQDWKKAVELGAEYAKERIGEHCK
jgi:tetratricopeptide (TPR) repeat protein